MKKKVLIESSKLLITPSDGVRRYLEELLDQLEKTQQDSASWQIDLLVGRHIIPIAGYKRHVGRLIHSPEAVEHEHPPALDVGNPACAPADQERGGRVWRSANPRRPFYARDYDALRTGKALPDSRTTRLARSLGAWERPMLYVLYFPLFRLLIHILRHPLWPLEKLAHRALVLGLRLQHWLTKAIERLVHGLSWGSERLAWVTQSILGGSLRRCGSAAVSADREPSAAIDTLGVARHGSGKPGEGSQPSMKTGLLASLFYKLYESQFPNRQAFHDYDLFFVPLPQNYGPFVSLKGKKRFVFTIHDLTHRFFSQFHDSRNILLAERGMRMANESHARVIAISESTKQDLLTAKLFSEEQVDVVYEAARLDFFHRISDASTLSRIREKYRLAAAGYFMTLSTIEPRKNILNTVKAFRRFKECHPQADVKLVICGAKGWKVDDLFKRNDLYAEDICFTGFVEDADLPGLFSDSLALIYVSYYEGFGLPILEAMGCGAPVIFGKNSSMPEIAGDGGLSAEADNVASIAEQMGRVYTDPELRRRLQRQAIEQARRFSWEKCARETLAVFDKALSNALDLNSGKTG